ncbi:MAG: diphthine--ammonia ligase [Candidatus Marsarchaeota archaeon]|nr:diphthine--ammonia ligase [Candidatus Marsarchaeota archaeon]
MTNACLFSGGKDSTLALHKAVALGAEIDLLITMRSANRESYMFHYPNVDMTKMQAEALGTRHVFADTEGKKEEELGDLEKALVDNDVKLLVTGATYSRYQADRINEITSRLGIEHIAPLWHIDPLDELNELASRYNVILTSVSAEGLETSLLGERIDSGMIEHLKVANRKHGINMLFEGGEAETFVLDAPLFKKSITVESSRIEVSGTNGIFYIEKAKLTAK